MSKIISEFESKFHLRLTLALIAGAIMYLFIIYAGGNLDATSLNQLAAIGAVLCVAFIVPIIAEKCIPVSYMAVGAVAAAALVYVRICMFYFVSKDYIDFLHPWLEQMRGLSLAEAMSTDIGDYNMPYLYFLFIISRININELYLIKLLSCLFDAVAAFFAMKIVGHFRSGAPSRLVAYLITLALPTVILNGSYWGQCDVMFASLCLGMVWAVLKGRSNLAVVLWTLAFAFKMQALFALPLLIIALFAKRIKPKSFLWIAPVFLGTLLPAIICGRTLYDSIKIYFEQANQYPFMHLNLSSIWALLGDVRFENFNSAAILLTGSAMVVFLFLCYHWRSSIDDRKLITLFFVGALLVPFLLPRMHDRYFFLADLAALMIFFIDLNKWYAPVITVLTSYTSYRGFVMGGDDLFDIKYTTIAILVLLTIVMKDLFKQMAEESATSKALSE